MNKELIIKAAEQFVHHELEKEASGHDWWHIYRVTQTSKTIAKEEGADEFVCELAALLHDIADDKLNVDEESGLQKVRHWLEENEVDHDVCSHVLEIITTMSFKGGNRPPVRTLEGQIVQDADRLDAIGAVGIARVFAYTGAKGRLIHDPSVQPRENLTYEQYRNGEDTGINHFYEKLLKLKDLMNTEYGKKMAQERHTLMEKYLKVFYLEWDGKR